jgi:hypothetical protein
MRLSNSLLPAVNPTLVQDIANELRWLKLRFDRQKKYLRQDEVERIEKVQAHLDRIVTIANELHGLQHELDRRRDLIESELERLTSDDERPISFYGTGALVALDDAYRRYARYAKAEPAELQVLIEEARRTVGAAEMSDAPRLTLNTFITAIDRVVTLRENLASEIDAYIQFVRDTEIALLGRVED